MKKVNGFVLSAIAGFVVTWLSICFVIWEINPGNMTEGQRFLLIWLSAGISGLSVCVYGINKKD